MKNATEFEQKLYNYLSDEEKKLIEATNNVAFFIQLVERHKNDSWEDFYIGVVSYIELCMTHLLIDDSYLEELTETNEDVL